MPGRHLRTLRLLSGLLRPQRRGRQRRQLPETRPAEVEAQDEEEDRVQVSMTVKSLSAGSSVSRVVGITEALDEMYH